MESVKAASDVYMPIDGKVIEKNEKVEGNPGLVNSAALTEAWFVKVKAKDMSQLKDLMDAAAYDEFCKSEH